MKRIQIHLCERHLVGKIVFKKNNKDKLTFCPQEMHDVKTFKQIGWKFKQVEFILHTKVDLKHVRNISNLNQLI